MSALPMSQDPSGKQTSLMESQLLQDVLQQLTTSELGVGRPRARGVQEGVLSNCRRPMGDQV